MDWQKLLSAVVPTAVALAKPGQSGASFVQGFQQSDQLMFNRRIQEEEANRRRQALDAETQNRAADNERQDQMARLNRLAMALHQLQPAVDSTVETAAAVPGFMVDPQAAATSLGARSQKLESTFGLDAGALQPMTPTAEELRPQITAAQIRKAKGWVKDFQATMGEHAGEALESFTIQSGVFAGMTPKSVYAIAEMTPPPKATPKARPEAAPGSFEDYTARYATEIGKTVDALTAKDIEVARKRYQQSDDKQSTPQNPRQRFQIQQVTNPDGTSGLIRVDLDSGETSRIQLPEGVAGAGRPGEGERTASMYLKRTEASNAIAGPFEEKLARLGRQFDVQMPNLLRSAEGQRYRQAQDEFINASLRRESGAAIQPSEYERYARIYFVMPGDTRDTILQKQEARRRVIEGFRTDAGNLQGRPAPSDLPPGVTVTRIK